MVLKKSCCADSRSIALSAYDYRDESSRTRTVTTRETSSHEADTQRVRTRSRYAQKREGTDETNERQPVTGHCARITLRYQSYYTIAHIPSTQQLTFAYPASAGCVLVSASITTRTLRAKNESALRRMRWMKEMIRR